MTLLQTVKAITLSTIHKSKGLEARRVWWLNSSRCPAPWAKRPWQQQQEINLCYVAATRAIETLILIEDGSYQRKRKDEEESDEVEANLSDEAAVAYIEAKQEELESRFEMQPKE